MDMNSQVLFKRFQPFFRLLDNVSQFKGQGTAVGVT